MGVANTADDLGRYQRVDTPAIRDRVLEHPTPRANHNNPGLRHGGWLPPGATRTAPSGYKRRSAEAVAGVHVLLITAETAVLRVLARAAVRIDPQGCRSAAPTRQRLASHTAPRLLARVVRSSSEISVGSLSRNVWPISNRPLPPGDRPEL